MDALDIFAQIVGSPLFMAARAARGMPLDASGPNLRKFVGGGDFVPYLAAAVAYVRTREEQPMGLAAGLPLSVVSPLD